MQLTSKLLVNCKNESRFLRIFVESDYCGHARKVLERWVMDYIRLKLNTTLGTSVLQTNAILLLHTEAKQAELLVYTSLLKAI